MVDTFRGFPVRVDWTVANHNLAIYCGSEWSWYITLVKDDGTYLDTSTYTARAHIRAEDDGDLELELTTANGRIVTGHDQGIYTGGVLVQIGANATDALTPGVYRYDLKLIPASGEDDRKTITWGMVDIVGDVTE